MPLPVPSDSIRVRLRARLESTPGVEADEAQFGFWGVRHHFDGNVTNWPEDVQTVADGVRDRWVEHVTITQYWSSAVVMDSVTVDHLNAADGTVREQGVSLFTGTGNTWKGAASGSLPWETSCAVSMYAYTPGQFTPNKQRKRGRMYLPPMSNNTMGDVTGQLSQQIVNAINTSMGAFFNDVQGMELNPDGPGPNADYFDLSVISRGTQMKPLEPAAYPIILVRVDSKVDSQRRRERQQPVLAAAQTTIAHS